MENKKDLMANFERRIIGNGEKIKNLINKINIKKRSRGFDRL